MFFNGLSPSLNFQYITLKVLIRLSFAKKPAKVLSFSFNFYKTVEIEFFQPMQYHFNKYILVLIICKLLFWKSMRCNDTKGRQNSSLMKSWGSDVRQAWFKILAPSLLRYEALGKLLNLTLLRLSFHISKMAEVIVSISSIWGSIK